MPKKRMVQQAKTKKAGTVAGIYPLQNQTVMQLVFTKTLPFKLDICSVEVLLA